MKLYEKIKWRTFIIVFLLTPYFRVVHLYLYMYFSPYFPGFRFMYSAVVAAELKRGYVATLQRRCVPPTIEIFSIPIRTCGLSERELQPRIATRHILYAGEIWFRWVGFCLLENNKDICKVITEWNTVLMSGLYFYLLLSATALFHRQQII